MSLDHMNLGSPRKQALLLNRIQNIVVPSRRPPHHHMRSSSSLRTSWAFFNLVLPSFFPIDLSSTYSRTILRLPTMYYILKSLVLWTILLLQAADYFPHTSWEPLQSLDEWVAHKEMDEICWFTFRAICGALCVGALTKGLEGVGTTPASPFNLVCPFHSVRVTAFISQCAVWLFLHATLLLLPVNTYSKTRGSTLPPGRECYFYYLCPITPGKRTPTGDTI